MERKECAAEGGLKVGAVARVVERKRERSGITSVDGTGNGCCTNARRPRSTMLYGQRPNGGTGTAMQG